METSYTYDEKPTFKVSEKVLISAAQSALKAICDELPNEAHRIDVIKHALEYCQKELNKVKVEL